MWRPKKKKTESKSIASRSTAFRNSFTTDKKIKLTTSTRETWLKGYLTRGDLKWLSGWYNNVVVYIPIQYTIHWKEGGKYSWNNKYNYEVKYLKVYLLLEDILNYFWFPTSLHKSIINKDLSYLTLETLLKSADKREWEMWEQVKVVSNREEELALRREKSRDLWRRVSKYSTYKEIKPVADKWFDNNEEYKEFIKNDVKKVRNWRKKRWRPTLADRQKSCEGREKVSFRKDCKYNFISYKWKQNDKDWNDTSV